jgi:hypothetical protein
MIMIPNRKVSTGILLIKIIIKFQNITYLSLFFIYIYILKNNFPILNIPFFVFFLLNEKMLLF